MARATSATSRGHGPYSAAPPAPAPAPVPVPVAAKPRGRKKGQVMNPVIVARRKLVDLIPTHGLYDVATAVGIKKPYSIGRAALVEQFIANWNEDVKSEVETAIKDTLERADEEA